MGKVLKMADAVGELTRIGPNTCIDANGNKIRTNVKVKHPGAGKGAGAGNPKIFQSPSDLIDAFNAFIDDVRDSDFETFPTKANFARFLGIDPKTVYNTIYKYFPEIKKEYMDVLADCLTEGATVGKWDKTMTIFCLKNWCSWADKAENVNTEIKPSLTDKKTADRLIKEYTERSK